MKCFLFFQSSSGDSENVEGLIYADLDLKGSSSANQGGKVKKGKKKQQPPLVRKTEPDTDYAVIDFSKKAPPVEEDENC